MRAGILLCLTVCLTGCLNPQVVRVPVEVVRIETQYLPVPSALTEPEACPTETTLLGPPRATYGEAVAAWKACLEAVRRANGRLRAIRSLEPPASAPVPARD